MSTPLREILARFSVKMDGVERVKAADDNVDGLIGRLGKLGQALAGSAIVYGMVRIGTSALTAASNANEAMNVIREVFKSDAGGVIAWSKAAGEELNRSDSLMLKMASTLGAMLEPMVGSTAAAAEMSTTLSTLAVDLASFYNISEEDALIKLRAGLSGEAEPLRVLGVNMVEANVAAFALAEGITKPVKAMSQGEKTQLRYNFIMAQTKNAQGDAARTAGSYANASRGAKDSVLKLMEAIGQKLIPTAESFLSIFTRVIPAIATFIEKSYLLEAVLILAAGAAARFALSLAAANVPILVSALGVAALVLAFEELMAAMDGEGVWGALADGLFGPIEKRAAFVEKMINGLKLAWLALQAILKGGDTTALDAEKRRQRDSGEARPGEDLDVTMQRRAAVNTQRGIDNRNMAVASGDLGSFLSAPGSARLSREDRFEQFKERRSEFLQSNPEAATDTDRATFGPGLQYVPPAGAGGAASVTNNTPVNIHLAPGTNRDTVNEVKRAVEDVMDRRDRQAHAAVSEQAPDA